MPLGRSRCPFAGHLPWFIPVAIFATALSEFRHHEPLPAGGEDTGGEFRASGAPGGKSPSSTTRDAGENSPVPNIRRQFYDRGMDLRILTEPQFGGTYEDQLAAARVAEASGYGGFFRSDHYLNRANPSGWPGPTDAWTTLAGLARETATIRIGTLVTAATLRHPSVLAISAAQVDQMSHGRLELGLGSGHDVDEHRLYGIPIPEVEERFDRYSEQLEIITGLWTTPAGAHFSFSGRHYSLAEAPALRTPVQLPMPPIIIGGMGKKRTPRLAAHFAHEFNVIFAEAPAATAQFERVEAAARAIGREPHGIIRSAAVAPAVGKTSEAVNRRRAVIRRLLPWLRSNDEDPGPVVAGSPSQVVDQIGRYREATGISRLYLDVPDVSDLDQVELIASDVKPQLEGT